MDKPILLDFTGYACVNCRKMEEQVWSDNQVKEIDKASHEWYAKQVIATYNKHNPVKPFEELSRAEQTVLVSVGFQHGTSFTRTDGSDMNFIKQAASGDWDAVLENLKNFGDKFPTRRNKEAKLLEDEKKIIEEERSQSETENQSKVDENNQPEGVDNQKNDPIPDSNQNNNENNDQTQNLDTSSEKKEENEILDNQNNEISLDSSQNNDQETTQLQTSETSSEKKDDDNGSPHEVIHKKDGRLHIYIRQDKYKGELKSKNWVGRLYIDGKQKISSSGTTNLEEAIPILEKWFDEVHEESEKLKKQSEEAQNIQSQTKTEEVQTQNTPPESIDSTPTQTPEVNQTNETQNQPVTPAVSLNESTETQNQDEPKSKLSNIFGKLKEIKLKKPSFAKNLPKPSLSSFN